MNRTGLQWPTVPHALQSAIDDFARTNPSYARLCARLYPGTSLNNWDLLEQTFPFAEYLCTRKLFGYDVDHDYGYPIVGFGSYVRNPTPTTVNSGVPRSLPLAYCWVRARRAVEEHNVLIVHVSPTSIWAVDWLVRLKAPQAAVPYVFPVSNNQWTRWSRHLE